MSEQTQKKLWHFESVTDSDGKTKYAVFDGTTADPIVTVRKESSAVKLVDSANKNGYPDVSAMVDDEED